MILFIVSPLIVYPLWMTKFGGIKKIIGLSWWALVMLASIFGTLAYTYHQDKYENESTHKYHIPPWNYAPWGYRNQCYLIGLMTGYILHVTKNKKIKINSKLNIFMWEVAFLVAFAVVYGPHTVVRNYSQSEAWRVYITCHKWCWGLCLSWVTFACVKGFGGFVNDFLSWGLWIPIAKISFMTYFFHMSFNWYYFGHEAYTIDYSMWLLTEMFIAQLAVDLFIGLIGCLTLELPFGKIQKIILQFIFEGK